MYGGFHGKLVIQGGGSGRGGQEGRLARAKAFREAKKAAKMEAAKIFVYNIDKVSQYYLMKISPGLPGGMELAGCGEVFRII